jgi:hypothetical protein
MHSQFLIDNFCALSALRPQLRSALSRLLTVSIVLWALCGIPAAYAQEQSAPGSQSTVSAATISTDRPSITDSSSVVPLGDLLFENGFAETANAGQRGFDFPETLIRYGLTSTTELRVTPPDYFENYNSTGAFGSGWGDFSLGVKQQLRATSEGFNAALIVSLSFPTGARVLSSHGYDPQFLLPWSHPILRNWTAEGMFSLFWPTQGTQRNLTGQASFLLDRQLTGKWDAFVEYEGEFPQRGGPQHVFHTGTSYKITANQQIDFHYGVGLSAAAVDHFVGFGYSFQLPGVFRRARRAS